MNVTLVQGIFSTNMFKSIRNKEVSEIICFVMVQFVCKETQNETFFSKVTFSRPFG